ncbi:MAG: FixH family protein [Geminicoccaceae bacterium]
MAALFILFLPAVAAGQSVDPFDFLEEWDLLRQDFRNGVLDVTEQGMPDGFDTEMSKPSEDGRFQVSIQPAVDPAPLNEIHTWLVEIKTPDGEPVSEADVSFYGGMPLHGHGFPTQPRIAGEIDPGLYALEGIKFSMGGWWTMGMGIVTEGSTDRVGFNMIFEP